MGTPTVGGNIGYTKFESAKHESNDKSSRWKHDSERSCNKLLWWVMNYYW